MGSPDDLDRLRDLLGRHLRVVKAGRYRNGTLVAIGYEDNDIEQPVVVVRWADGSTTAFPPSMIHLEPLPGGGEVEHLAGVIRELRNQPFQMDDMDEHTIARRIVEAGYVRGDPRAPRSTAETRSAPAEGHGPRGTPEGPYAPLEPPTGTPGARP